MVPHIHHKQPAGGFLSVFNVGNVAVRSSGGVKVDGYLRSSDPHIYAVGEVASYEGGMVYGLWKPGTEQAEVRRPFQGNIRKS